ncbi:MAG: HAMP domain-containing histidine kinase [Eubacteriales bacterium]|nr:HAMP domain-containing histidine kinase [Eubacteriales bacterium]
MFKSLRSQLSLSILALLLVIILLMGVVSNLLTNRAFETYVQQQEEARIQTIVSDLAAQYNGMTRSWDADFLHTIGMYSLYSGYLLKVYNINGDILWDAENHDMTLCGQIMAEITDRMEKAKKTGSFQSHEYAVTQGQTKVGSVTISYYTPFFYSENDHQFINTLNAVFLGIGAVAGVFAVALGALLARRIARPLAQTAEAAKQVAQGEYGIRVASDTNTQELNDLVASINHLAGALDEQEMLRKRLTTDVAHELRTPLTAVMLYLEAMIEGLWDVSPERLKDCHEELTRLSRLVTDILQLANVEGGNLQLRKEKADLLEIAEAVSGIMSAQAKAKGQSLTVTGEHAIVNVDRERMQQVLINLVSNAIKYAPQDGHISIETEVTPDAVLVRVRDDGIGIAEAELPLIFERFYRSDQSRDRRTGGTGIGLTIAKSIVAAHGGTIRAESKPGGGSCFIVAIPRGSGE